MTDEDIQVEVGGVPRAAFPPGTPPEIIDAVVRRDFAEPDRVGETLALDQARNDAIAALAQQVATMQVQMARISQSLNAVSASIQNSANTVAGSVEALTDQIAVASEFIVSALTAEKKLIRDDKNKPVGLRVVFSEGQAT
jgi:hypothetical protein